ncbi:histidine phosphatase family protein [Treponema sp. HNW]|uniref:histidine phosphatase family protein n=1 Tax=Treponema sp. HNW TaxID=3116654 RepID=UPI003D0B18CB
MKLFITRHGETDWNVEKRICGCSESKLTEKGHLQARELAKRLAEDKEKNDIRYIYVSPLKRARDTASYIEKALGIKALPDKRIQEVFFGDFEGVHWVTSPEFREILDNPFAQFPGGESLVQASCRAYSLIDEVRKTHSEDGNILFVCHGMITVLMHTYFKSYKQSDFLNLRVENCQLLEFDF